MSNADSQGHAMSVLLSWHEKVQGLCVCLRLPNKTYMALAGRDRWTWQYRPGYVRPTNGLKIFVSLRFTTNMLSKVRDGRGCGLRSLGLASEVFIRSSGRPG